MKKTLRALIPVAILLIGVIFSFSNWVKDTQAQVAESSVLVVGSVLDTQNQPVPRVAVTLRSASAEEPLAEAETQADGRYVLPAPQNVPDNLNVHFERSHFQDKTVQLGAVEIGEDEIG